MENKINRDIINIVRSYLTVSKNEVKRNKKLLEYEINVLCGENISLTNKFNTRGYLFSYCLFCDQLTYDCIFLIMNYRL